MSWDPLDDDRAAQAASAEPLEPGFLVAVDLGLRTGIAAYDRAGTLCYARARRFPSRDRLRAAVPGLLAGLRPLCWLVLEGDAALARPWVREARMCGAKVRFVKPETWRRALMPPREFRTGAMVKQHAQRRATALLAEAGRPPVVPLRHDAAEAALIGLWALAEVGWTRPERESTRR